MRWPSAASQPGSIVAVTPDGGMPTSTVAPLRFISETALFGRALDADGDEDTVGLAPAGELGDPRGDILGPGVDRVGRAEVARGLELGVGRRRRR